MAAELASARAPNLSPSVNNAPERLDSSICSPLGGRKSMPCQQKQISNYFVFGEVAFDSCDYPCLGSSTAILMTRLKLSSNIASEPADHETLATFRAQGKFQ